ncbi:MAG TPA: AAA family ATPase [Bacilli bacterium]|nr:AAA family ATPase [Bacilli bacterium]
MQAVQVTVDMRHWLSALHDLTTRAASFESERDILLAIDPVKQTLSLYEDAHDSHYRVTLPLVGNTSGMRIQALVAVSKLEPMLKLYSSSRGELTLTARRTTLSFKRGKKQILLPNRLVGAATEWHGDSFARQVLEWEQPTRFAIPSPTHLLQAVTAHKEPLLKARVEKGTVFLGDHLFPAMTREDGAECLLPRDTLARRLQQLPEHVSLEGVIGDHRGLFLRAQAGSIWRELYVRPLPATTLFISKRRSERVIEQEQATNLFWTQTAKEQAGDRKTSPAKAERSPDRENRWPERDTQEHVESPSDHRPPIVRARDLLWFDSEPDPRDEVPNSDLFDETDGKEILSNAEGVTQVESELHDESSDSLSPHTKPVVARKLTALERLEKLPGLHQVKKQLRDIAHFAVFEQERMEVLGLPQKTPTLHMAFLGNPGTGKTMVARMIGRIYRESGLLSKGHVVEVDRSSLIGAYMGHTEANLAKYIKRAQGGVLFVDEAYALYKKDSGKDFGKNAIDGLVKAMEDHKNNFVVILAGYKAEMREFLQANPGLKERVPFHIDFPDYSEPELLQIADYLAGKDHYTLTPDAKEVLLKRVLREKLDETFGNGRTVRNLIEKAVIRHAVRAAHSDPSEETYTTLTADDFQVEDLPEQETLDDVLSELESLVGLEEVKRLVRQMVDVLALEKKRVAHGLQDQPLTLHMAFTGNPGTGKTTVARLMGRLLRAMDLLPKGHFVEASRKDLVAGYMGQTTLKTAEKIKEAMGGVLFIDEAYALGTRGQKDFGAEALATLIKEMEDRKGLLTVILAGYTQEMEDLFRLNPGLKSRVRFTLHFPDYTASDLVEIVKRKAQQSQYELTEEAEEKLWQLFIRECSMAGDDFGNGRLAEQVFEKAKLRLSTRVGRLDGEVEKEVLMRIMEEDVET